MASFSPVFTIEEDDTHDTVKQEDEPANGNNSQEQDKLIKEEDKPINEEDSHSSCCTTVAEKTVGTVAFCLAVCMCFGCCSLKEMRESFNEHTCCGQCCPM
jgi:hypothetical protein